MLQSPTNQIIVKFKTKYIKNISTLLKIAEIQNLSSVSAADCVNIVCEIVSLPKVITKEFEKYSLKDVRPGDVAIVSHDVIFSFGSTAPEEDPIYKNQFHYKAEEYFTCNPRNLFATIRDGNVRMQNGYVMVGNMQKLGHLHLPQHLRKMLKTSSATITHIGHPMVGEKNINAEPGDTIYYNPNKIILYQINEKPFGILKQSQILSRKVPSAQDLAILN